MAGNTFGNHLHLTTFGESHGRALGCVLDGFPAGMALSEEDIQPYLNRRRPGGQYLSTARTEADTVEIISGVFEGRTTGSPIAMITYNSDQQSADYDDLKSLYRPGHADFSYAKKYGIRDHRGGGRSSGRETVARVMGGAVCMKLLKDIGIDVTAYTRSIGDVTADESTFDKKAIYETKTAMPDRAADEKARALIEQCRKDKDSVGSSVRCVITGLPAGLGDPVFDKLDALLSHAVMSLGAVKAVEIGDGRNVSAAYGSENNDIFVINNGSITTATNHAGGILGGISTGTPLILTAHFKPTASIAKTQQTVTTDYKETSVEIKGRHDPVIAPRAVVVVETMCAFVLLDAMLGHMSAKAEDVIRFYV